MDGDTQQRPFKKRRLTTDERQRAVRACASCRRLKEKCEGGYPCKRCTHFQRHCEFTSTTTTTSTKTATEPVKEDPTQVTREEPPRERQQKTRVECLERIVKHHYPNLPLSDLARLRQKAAQLVREPSVVVPESDSDGSPDEDIAIDGEHTVLPVGDTTVYHSGEFSYWNFSMRIKQHVSELMAQTPDHHEPQSVPDYWRVEELHTDSTELADARASFPPRQVAGFLAHVFFKHASSNYFYVEQQSFMYKLNMMYDSALQVSQKDVCSIAIMLAVFAIGTQYAHLESEGRNGTSVNTGDGWEGDIGTLFYRSAAKLLPQIIHIASLESVQATLLFGLYALPIDAAGLAYVYLNLAIRLAVQNGMHRHIANNKLDPKSIEIRDRVWWTIYCTERKISIFHGRPTSIQRTDVDTTIPSNDNESGGLPILIKLTDYLEDFLSDLVLLRRCQKSELSGILSRLSSKNEQLRKWWSNSRLDQDNTTNATIVGSRALLHVRLEYNLVRMFVGRVFLFSRSGMGTTPSAASDGGLAQPAVVTGSANGDDNSARPSRTKCFIDNCIQAALDVIKVCGTIRESGIGLAKSSYIEYSSCRAALLVLIAYCIHNQTDQYHHKLQKGLDLIREMSSVGASARSEVLLIESLERAVKRLHFLSSQKPTMDEEKPGSNGYDTFRKWTSMLRTGVPSGDDLSSSDLMTFDESMNVNNKVQYAPETPKSQSWWPPQADFSLVDHTDGLNQVHGDYNNALGHLQSAAGTAFFGFDTIDSSFLINSERQLMDSFLAAQPDYDFQYSDNASHT